jgi:dihydroorotate dehydrogenase (NAD+) catalytic subunit
MIELGPQHKTGLVVANPVLLAGGTIGYGEAIPRGLAVDRLGAVVIGPIAVASRAGAPPPRLAETNGGFVLNTGMQNRGISAALKRFGKLWPRLGCPVIAQIAEARPASAARLAAQFAGQPGISGLELALPRESDDATIAAAVRQVAYEGDLPVWVKAPLERAAAWAAAAASAGANGIVIGQPPLGVVSRRPAIESKVQSVDTPESASPLAIQGELFGPLLFPLMLRALVEVARLELPCALIACGGIHTGDQLRQTLAAGAQAAQIDSAVWVEPGLPGWLLDDWLNAESTNPYTPI